MPKSRRAKVFHLTQVDKKTREHKEKLFENIRATLPQYQYCFVLGFDNMRNTHLKDVRHELSDSRIFFGKTKLMARALGTSSPSDALSPGLDQLNKYLTGTVAILLTNRGLDEITEYFASFSPVDFARAGAVASRDVVIPQGVVYSTGGLVAAEDDVPMGHSIEPELRRLGMPVRMVRGKVVLGGGGGQQQGVEETGAGAAGMEVEGATEGDEEEEDGGGYVVCREGQVLDSRQTRLLKLFDQCLSEFKVNVLSYWTAATGEVVELKQNDDVENDMADDA